MPAVTTKDEIVREDISDVYLNIDARDTPLLKDLRQGERIKNVDLFSWEVEKYTDNYDTVGIPENKDADQFEGNKQYQLYNRTMKFWGLPHVTMESNDINVTVADFGKQRKEIVNKTVEMKRKIEKRIASDNDSKTDDGVAQGREFMGLGRIINDTTSIGSSNAALPFGDTQTSINPLFRTPTAQIYVGPLTDINGSGEITPTFSEAVLIAMVKSRFDNVGQQTDLTCYCDSTLKTHFSKYLSGRYEENVRGYTAVARTPQEAITMKEYALYGADILKTDFGVIQVKLMSFMPRRPSTVVTDPSAVAGRGYFLDMTKVAIRPSGKWLTYMPLEDKGAGPRGLIQSLLGLAYGDPRGHMKVDPNVLQTTST
jgi:hypothetical protein